jgi:hypothetical protein
MKLEWPQRNKKIHSIPDIFFAAYGWLKDLDNPLWNFVRYMHRNHGFKDALRMALNK